MVSVPNKQQTMTENNPNTSQSTNIPSPEIIEAAAQIKIFDSKGNKVPFGDLFTSTKTVVVFIRHFFCGTCQAYVAQLASVPEKALSDANIKLAIVGCGGWELIDVYKKNTGFSGEAFADPSRELYRKLGMTKETTKRTPSGQQKRSYAPAFVPNVLRSIWNGIILHPVYVASGKHGNISQLGGEFVLGPGNSCHFAHLMEHTEDHVEVVDLMKIAGVEV